MNIVGLLESFESPPKVAFRPVSTEARRALQAEILPQIGDVTSVAQLRTQVADIVQALRVSFKEKDTFYTRLIRHKAIDQTDAAYYSDLSIVLKQWVDDTMDRLTKRTVPQENPVSPAPPAPAPQVVVVQQPIPQENPVHKLKLDLQRELGADKNMTPWDLAQSLTNVFRNHGIKGANAHLRSKRAVGVGFDVFGVDDMELHYRNAQGWSDRIGLHTSDETAKELLVRLASVGG